MSRSGGATLASVQTIQDESVALTQRTVLDFQGAGVTVADSGGKTVATIPGVANPTPQNAGGNIGAGVTFATGGVLVSVLRNVTLNSATATVTVTGLPAGKAALFHVVGVQDATGNRVLRIDDGAGPVTIPITSEASRAFEVTGLWDGTETTYSWEPNGGSTLAAADGGSATSTYGPAEFIDGGGA